MKIPPPGPRFTRIATAVTGATLVAGTVLGLGAEAKPVAPPEPATSSVVQGAVVALGDSIDFGADPTKSPANPADFPAYADQIGKDKGWKVVNFGQPGESSASLLDNTARNNGGWVTDPATGQRIHDRPLHQNYSVDQADAAVEYLKNHPEVKLVTLTIGGNDLLMLQTDSEKSGFPTPVAELWGLPDTAEDLSENVSTALQKIRAVYKGPIVVTNQYSTDYSKPVNGIALGAASLALDNAVRSVNLPGQPAVVADVYKAFEKATAADPAAKGVTGAAGLLIPYQGGYDLHPTQKGRELIAKTIEAADPLWNKS